MAAVLVHIDLDGDRAHPASLAALAAGRLVASSWGATLYAAVIARDTVDGRNPDSTTHALTTEQVPGFEALQPELARAGADKIVVALTDVPVTPLWASVGAAWQGVLDHLRPRLVLFGADAPSAIEVAPRTGAKIGARLLVRARPLGVEDVELRDRDGGYVRAQDSGAAVVLVGAAPAQPAADDDVDVIVLALPGGGDERIEVTGSAALAPADSCAAIVVLGDDVAQDAAAAAAATALADKLGARVIDVARERARARAVRDDRRRRERVRRRRRVDGRPRRPRRKVRRRGRAGRARRDPRRAREEAGAAVMTDELEGVTTPWRPPDKRPIAVWLGSAAPVRSIRWLDGALAAAAKLGATNAIAAGEPELARPRGGSRVARAGRQPRRDDRPAARLPRLGADRGRRDSPAGASTILVDEASRPERFAEVAAIAELLDAAQLTHVVVARAGRQGAARAGARRARSSRRCACAGRR